MIPDRGRPADAWRPRQELVEFGLVSGGKVAALASLIACNVLVARSVSAPGEYGRYAAAIALVLLLDAALGAPIDLSVIRFAELRRDDPDRIDRVHAAAFRLKLMFGALLLVVAGLYGNVAAGWYFGDRHARTLLVTAVVAAMVMLLVRSAAVRLQVQGQFVAYAALDGLQGLFRLAAIGLPILLGWRSAESFLAAHVIGTVLAFTAAFAFLPKSYLLAPWPSRNDLRESIVQTALSAGIVVVGTLTGRSDIPIVAAVRSADDAGHYAAALQVATLVTLVASYYGVVMQPRILQLSRDRTLKRALGRNVIAALVVSGLVAMGALWILPAMLPALFGARYGAALPIAQVLLVGTCFDLFSMPIMMVYAIQKFSKAMLIGEVAIGVVFFWLAFDMAEISVLAMAWLVTAVRLTKLGFYAGIILRGESERGQVR